MKTLDVSGLHSGIDEIKTKIEHQQEQLKQIETSVMGIVRLSDSLKGEGGTAIRRFYQECHLPFIHYLTGTLAQYEQLLMQMKSSLQAFEPASNGRIQESFLEQEVENGLKQVELVTTSLTNQTNATMQKVQDIVYLKPLQDDEVRKYVQKAKQEKDQTLEQLHQFDYEQAAALSPVETDTHMMQSYIKEIQAMFKGGAGLNQGSINLMINHSSHMLLMNKLAQRNMAANLLHTNQPNSLHTNWQDPITFDQWYNPSCAKPVAAANATAEAEDTGGFFKGAWQGIAKAFTDTVDGIKRLVTEPVEVLNETVDFITDVADDPSLLLDIGHALWISFDENVINGTASTRGEWIGYTSAIIGGSVLGDKGLSKVSQAGRLGQLRGKPGYSSQHQLQLQLAAQNSLNQTANAATNARRLTHIRELAQQSMNRFGAAVHNMTPNAGLQPALAGIPHNVINTNGMRNQLGEINQANLIKVEQGAGVRGLDGKGSSKVNKDVSAVKKQVDDVTLPENMKKWDYTPTEDLFKKYENVYKNPKYYNQNTGEINWPPNDGFVLGTQKVETLNPGTKLDRYGNPTGSFLAPESDSFPSRSLAPHSEKAPYYVYEVIDDLEVTSGKIAPWFDQPGGGTQIIKYKPNGRPYSIEELIELKVIKQINP
ncbi:T7SS effector LXG polymorphic toxin [Alkalihalophilus marmarensis]|uniref:T7SS effector LXG polymorphic toxin n=2 Tax=Alkalihalophilus marmarensis TaxID=521377 RepID=UPI002DB896AD|nr:T7SS effector LXG polymorphic toxin [Alkalihalophilus marmarensis]MEC2072515.1 T7SS effector LXG polymorphic toxin [Alkalihalophilus marmarensis]